MPFQPGNTLAVSRRTVESVLRKAAHRDMATLDRACVRVIQDAADHSNPNHRLACLQFVADRLDGRARQSIELSGDTPRELAMSDLVRLVLAARTNSADEAQVVDSPVLSAPAPAADPAP